MLDIPTIVIVIIVCALFFDYTNGFHDTANAVSSVLATRVLSPNTAIIIAAIFNFIGALTSTYVAKTIVQLVDYQSPSYLTILAAILGATVWNLITWAKSLPSSSSHALIGGIVGAEIIHGNIDAVNWQQIAGKVLFPMVGVPALGFIVGLILMVCLYYLCSFSKAGRINQAFSGLQILASGFKAFAHGQSDAQKTMGIITATLLISGLHTGDGVPLWVMLSCAGAIGLGTAVGGWRIIKTMATKVMVIQPIHGFAADTSAALVLLVSSLMGMPVSTSHIVAGSLFGVGTAKRVTGVRWSTGKRILVAWITTFPGAALITILIYLVLYLAGLS